MSLGRYRDSMPPNAHMPHLMLAPKLMGHYGEPNPPRGHPALAACHRCPSHARMTGDSPTPQCWPSPVPCNHTLGSQRCRHGAHHGCVGLTSLPGRWHVDQRWGSPPWQHLQPSAALAFSTHGASLESHLWDCRKGTENLACIQKSIVMKV